MILCLWWMWWRWWGSHDVVDSWGWECWCGDDVMMLPKTLLNFLLPNATMQDISRLMPLGGVYSNNFRYFSSIPSTFARTTKTWYARRCQDRMQQASAVFIGCSSTFYISILFYLLHFKFKIRECPVDIAGHKTKGCLHVWVETWMTSDTAEPSPTYPRRRRFDTISRTQHTRRWSSPHPKLLWDHREGPHPSVWWHYGEQRPLGRVASRSCSGRCDYSTSIASSNRDVHRHGGRRCSQHSLVLAKRHPRRHQRSSPTCLRFVSGIHPLICANTFPPSHHNRGKARRLEHRSFVGRHCQQLWLARSTWHSSQDRPKWDLEPSSHYTSDASRRSLYAKIFLEAVCDRRSPELARRASWDTQPQLHQWWSNSERTPQLHAILRPRRIGERRDFNHLLHR